MSAAKLHDLPQNIAEMRLQVVERFAALFENQIRNQNFRGAILRLVSDVHQDVITTLQQGVTRIAEGGIPADERDKLHHILSSTINRCRNLEAALPFLLQTNTKRGGNNCDDLKRILLRFDQATQWLAGTLIEKNLLERQSAVLEQIILSHEKVTQWKSFVQEILGSFHTIFPFQFFFIAFAEEHGLGLNIYYVGTPDESTKSMVRTRLAKEMISGLHLPDDLPIDFEEFEIESDTRLGMPLDVEMITVAVPEMDSVNLAGLLGIAYASTRHPGEQELAVIRSILAVMVMVVGSSKALGRTLDELEYYSNHDPLTGLHNRRYFSEMIEYEVDRSERHGHEFSLLMLDLDDFKDVNDTWGHPCGDTVLRRIAELLRVVTRKGDLIARLGGDEFIILLTETGAEAAYVVAEKLRNLMRNNQFAAPDGKHFHVTTSIGAATFPQDAQSVSDLMTGVDVGLYRAKELGKDGIGSVAAVKDRVQHKRQTRDFVEHLRNAIGEGRLIPYFQPIYDCHSGELFAYEALARLIEPNGETLSAGAFIETIEKYGLSRDLDRAVIYHGLHALRRRLDAGKPPVLLFINLSMQEIQGRGVIGYAEKLCAELDIPPSHLVFEIIERDAISDMTHMRSFLNTLRKKGFLFALDDFGSGYNSFHYLRELAFDFVKIDGAFVRNIINSKVDYSLVKNLSQLCQDLGILTVGEFVESAELQSALQSMNVNYAQGFHLGVPGASMT
ncbi:bifunctional diguanylate cyclase/phosphodiesterase [Vogesella sp. LIG4]|uniref:putative bifunctional diguanylate cyclase/phosphodiesterase n=1 Tax=Vogesella sp. LIG4 TaxID=1192162 RepID=UPI00081FE52E|nr:bifunctional diguanylate cyclase/phosphodiesterase [Vogesella sp. LIG4]SCK24931.1 diguanylate cyclase (GGDEF) domain-containing protein [Vogesella sp. LIG4]